MLKLHEIADAINGKSPVVWCDTPNHEWAKLWINIAVKEARKFDFGLLHFEEGLEFDPELGRMTTGFYAPKLTEQEIGFWKEQLIPLPFPLVWYEFELQSNSGGSNRLGLLINETPTGWDVTSFQLTQRGRVITSAAVLMVPYTDPMGEQRGGYKLLVSSLQQEAEAARTCDGMSGKLAMYLTLMLTSKTTETRQHVEPRMLNSARKAMGRTPKQDHTVITIVPKRFTSGGSARATGGGRALHWRRSHLRHFDHPTPGSKWVPDMVHDGRTGWYCAVIPRHLVGRAELGEVTHNYRVKGDSK